MGSLKPGAGGGIRTPDPLITNAFWGTTATLRLTPPYMESRVYHILVALFDLHNRELRG